MMYSSFCVCAEAVTGAVASATRASKRRKSGLMAREDRKGMAIV
jgi:hypothetical protein